MIVVSQRNTMEELTKALLQLAKRKIKKKINKKKDKLISKINGKVPVKQAKDLILSSQNLVGRPNEELFLLSLYPDERSISRPIYRQASRAVYVKNITKISVTTDATYGSAYTVFNPWSIVNTYYIGSTWTNANTVASTTVQTITNNSTYTNSSFKTYRVIGAKIKLINRQAPLNAAGLIQVAGFDLGVDPTSTAFAATVANMQQSERYAEVEVPHLTEIFLPQILTDRTYGTATIGSTAYPGDMMAIFLTGAPTNTIVYDFVLEQDLELEPTPGTFYSNLASPAEQTCVEMHGVLDNRQDKIMRKVYYTSESEIFNIVGLKGSKTVQMARGAKMVFKG